VVLATALAIALQTTLARFMVGTTVVVDLVLVVVVSAALIFGPVTGLLTGTFAGLLLDTLSTGVIGIGGLAKTIVGFLAGIVGTQFIVVQPLPRFVVLVAATALHSGISIGLAVLLGLRQFDTPLTEILTQGVGNGIVGVIAFQLAELLPGAVERRKLTRTKLRR
jgi:rod shape-determining protein MreD